MTSWNVIIPSNIFLPLKNQACSRDIRVGSKNFNLLEITLAIILKMTLHKAIGMYLTRVFAPLSFGIRVTKVAMKFERTSPIFPESYIISRSSSFIISQHAWKKFVVNSSGPGAFPSSICLTASSISYISTSLRRRSLFSYLTREGINSMILFVASFRSTDGSSSSS